MGEDKKLDRSEFMSQLHEIKIVNVHEGKIIDIIYIHDDFWGYVGERNKTVLIENIPVFYPSSVDLDGLYQGELTYLDTFSERKPIKKGISITGINIINSFSFDNLLDVINELKYIANGLDDYELIEFDSEFTKNKTINNLEKLSTILKNIIPSKKDYIILWEGI